MTKWIIVTLKLTCLFALGVWILIGICSLLSAKGIRMTSEYIRFPLSNINDWDIDSEGRIYAESGFWGRLQVYSSSGKFLKGWFSGSCGGVCQIEVDSEDHIHVYTARGDRYGDHYTYDEKGKLIKKEPLREIDSYKYKKRTNREIDHLGMRYQFRDGFLFPKIVRLTPSGEINLVVENPLYLKIFEPMWLVFSVVVALVLLSFVEHQKASRKRKQIKTVSEEK